MKEIEYDEYIANYSDVGSFEAMLYYMMRLQKFVLIELPTVRELVNAGIFNIIIGNMNYGLLSNNDKFRYGAYREYALYTRDGKHYYAIEKSPYIYGK